jgi:hypothetical protein
MSDEPMKPDVRRAKWTKRTWAFAVVVAPVAYMGAYYATYRPNMEGRSPGWHHYYMIGSDYSGWEIPLPIADRVFAPARSIDRHLIRTGPYHD